MQEIKMQGLDEVIYHDTINGLKVYVWPNQKVKGMFASLSVKYGSIHQEFKVNGKNYQVPSGIAHFLEHLCFYEDENTTSTDFFSKYGSEVNAYTTFNYTCYHVYATEEIQENIKHLLDFVLNPYFSKKTLNKERGIIIEETKMDEDLPESNLYYTHFKDLFHKYKYRDQITGKIEDIKNITLEDILLVYNTFYRPENMFLIVCGNVNYHEVFKLVEETLKDKTWSKIKEVKLKKYREPKEVKENYEEIFGNVEKDKIKISVKVPLSNFKEIDEVSLRIIASLILNANFGATSDLKEYLMEEELINFMGIKRIFIEDYLILSITLETDFTSEVIEKIKKSFKNLTMSEENLKRKINSSIATLVLNYDDIMDVNDYIQMDILTYDKVIANIKDILSKITLDDVLKVINKIDTSNIAITVLKKNEN